MRVCPNCASEVIAGAKYCHRCGDRVVDRSKSCPVCTETNPVSSVFCHHCGYHFDGASKTENTYQPVYPFVFEEDTMTEQVRQLFFKAMRARVEEEHEIDQYSDYVERFYQSRFHEIYTVRASQIANEVWVQWDRFGQEALPEIDRRVMQAFEGLLDYFIIQFCPDLSKMVLPEAILKYEKGIKDQTDLWPMMQDYLGFDREDEQFYFDLISMNSDLLENACKNFLKAPKEDRILVVGDLSLKGNCKEGFALTEKAVYWKNAFGKARSAKFTELRHLKFGKDWILINGFFFTVNPNFNLKFYKLLKKIRQNSRIVASSERQTVH